MPWQSSTWMHSDASTSFSNADLPDLHLFLWQPIPQQVESVCTILMTMLLTGGRDQYRGRQRGGDGR